ncbi:MAG: hypothetical protein M0R17_01230 [Candidatus Omnitrophica bacterium]|nr:hypothetical protein [Candidatus Omnitrophota bacterium]
MFDNLIYNMELNVTDDNGNELTLKVSKHALHRFSLRYSILYKNILNEPIYKKIELFKEFFYNSTPFIDEKHLQMDIKKNRHNYYLKSNYLLFTISKETLVVLTVLCYGEFEYLNKFTIEQISRSLESIRKSNSQVKLTSSKYQETINVG